MPVSCYSLRNGSGTSLVISKEGRPSSPEYSESIAMGNDAYPHTIGNLRGERLTYQELATDTAPRMCKRLVATQDRR